MSENLSYSQLNATDVDLDLDILCYVISMLHDPQEMMRLFGSLAICNRTASWYSLSGESLFKCLNFHIVRIWKDITNMSPNSCLFRTLK